MRAVAIVRTSSNGSSGWRSPSGVPSTRTSRLTGTLSGCGSSDASCWSRPIADPPIFAHADDAAAADRDAGLPHARQRLEPIVVGARRDDAAVELGRGVEVVVVGGQPGVGERVGLLLRQHAERAAGFHAEPAHAADHRRAPGSNAGRPARRARPRPCRSASRPARVPAGRRVVSSSIDTSSDARDVGLVVRRLRAVGAVLRTAAGLDAEQHAALHLVGAMVSAMHGLRAEDEIRQRRRIDRFDLGDGPVVADVGRRSGHKFASLSPTAGEPAARAHDHGDERNSRTDNADRVVGRRRREVQRRRAPGRGTRPMPSSWTCGVAFRSTGLYLASVVAVPQR